MNKRRRDFLRQGHSQIEDAKGLIDMALEEEQESYDNLPDSIQASGMGDEMQENIDALQEITDALDEVLSNLEDLL